MKYKDTLYLIDGSSYIYRAYFAIRRLSNSKGLPTNAVYGFIKMVMKVIKECDPKYLGIIYDSKQRNFRHKLYPEYKATRKKMDNELKEQIPYIKRLVAAYNIPSVEVEAFEADDVIAAAVKKFAQKGLNIVIISGDKDLMQLIGADVTMLDTMKDKEFKIPDVVARFKVPPEKVRDVLALAGDSSDNIPGVPGVGEKTAAPLIERYGSLEGLYEHIDELKGKKAESIKENRAAAFLSRELVTLDSSVDIGVTLDDLVVMPPDYDALLPLLKELEFTKLITELPGETVESDVSYDDYHLVKDKRLLDDIITDIRRAGAFSVDLETTSPTPMLADIVGISISYSAHKAYYIPVAHTGEGSGGQLDKEYVLSELKPLLEDENIRKIAQNIKYEYIIFKRYGIGIKGGMDDTMIASYLLNPSKHNHRLSDISMDHLNHKMILYKEVAGAGKSEVAFDKVSVNTACTYSAEDADVTYLLAQILLPKLKESDLAELYEKIELPLVRVLADMEMTGVYVDKTLLGELSKRFEKTMVALKKEVYKEAGCEFNLNSPKQLSDILFNKLNMPVIKKTKTGYSTDVFVLTELAETYDFTIPRDILRYRSISKLKSTYADALVSVINPRTNRVHTSYNQTVTSTGRLSSSEPNLQNIPARTNEGRLIRSAFAAEKGKLLVSADYSQVELRILADMSGDEAMLRSFENGEDIHTSVAAEVFEIFPAMVTPEMRRTAKVINFGIVYGMSPYGLARELKISPKLAKKYIDGYFNKYKRVWEYIQNTIKSARENGYVTTLFKRRLYLPEINSKNKNVAQMAERNAINAPIQGTAADVIKIAMIKLFDRINANGLKSKMILQVHDELLFEAAPDELEIMRKFIKEEMEGAGKPFITIPLKVEIQEGVNWSDAH